MSPSCPQKDHHSSCDFAFGN
uniref:Uncharacterized protein n=1 Tax=Anguilla anguilla TaxID=7936 RepID=A0A0E9TDE2_ANGAN